MSNNLTESYNIKELSLYDSNQLENIFQGKEKIIAYGNGSLYRTVNRHITELGYSFDDVVYNIENNFFSSTSSNIHEVLNSSIIIICTIHHNQVIEFLSKYKVLPSKIILVNLNFRHLFEKEKKLQLFKESSTIQKKIINKIQKKTSLKIVYLVILKSTWKADLVFKKMLASSYFKPMILVCPCITHTNDHMWHELKETHEYFIKKGYPSVLSYNHQKEQWIKLSELKPDVIIFTNSHNITKTEYYENAYKNFLSCYIPYYSDIASNYNKDNVYNQVFHNTVWRIFYDSKYTLDRAKKASTIKAINAVVTGNPFLENFFINSGHYTNWKYKHKKRIVYAPHQSIIKIDNLQLSTFLLVSTFMQNLALKYQSHLEWCFKPHPMLKSNLYKHPDWGKKKTDEYYSFWANFSSGHINEGEYIELFKSCDAIIHDCGSFILEGLLSKKPCGYLLFNPESQLYSINKHGKKLLKCHHLLDTEQKIENFIIDIIHKKSITNKSHKKFIQHYTKNNNIKDSPSSLILENLKKSINRNHKVY